LRRTNQFLMEGVCQGSDREQDNDIDELVQTLNELKDSEAKLKTMLGSVLRVSESADSLNSKDVNTEESPEPIITEISDKSIVTFLQNDSEKQVNLIKCLRMQSFNC
jgi:hypothetical protein